MKRWRIGRRRSRAPLSAGWRLGAVAVALTIAVWAALGGRQVVVRGHGQAVAAVSPTAAGGGSSVGRRRLVATDREAVTATGVTVAGFAPDQLVDLERAVAAALGHPPAAGQRDDSWLPLVGRGLGTQVRTCLAARTRAAPTRGATCAAWGLSGPVNVVVFSPPSVDVGYVLHQTDWRPAAGRWIVAQGWVDGSVGGCPRGWHDSGPQVEFRLNPLERHHLKPVSVVCHTALGSLRVTFGNAHTDLWERRLCAGDRAVDWDQAREAAVRSLLRSGHVVAAIEVPALSRTSVFPGGCNRVVPTDGRVAYIVLV